jgi:superfamily II DNA helicase RecQ
LILNIKKNKIIKCLECDKEIEASFNYCPYCGKICVVKRIGSITPDSSEFCENAGLIILKCLSEIKINAGRSFLSNVLKGSKSKKIIETKQNNNNYFGYLNRFTLEEIIDFIDQLIDEGYLELDNSLSKYNRPILKISKKGERSINNQEDIKLNVNSTEAFEGREYLIKIDNIKLDYPRAYEPWNDEEEKMLIQLFNESKPLSVISKLMGRQNGGIKSRLKKLGLIKE